jgi:hypothetical protein
MVTPVFVCVLCSALGALSGQVVDASGNPIAKARVFVEYSLESPLVERQSDASGQFAFPEASGDSGGVFAIAPGYAFGGVHLKSIAGAGAAKIVLNAPATLSGIVVTSKGRAIAGARITRVALLDASKVGIPLAKLAELGTPAPVSDAEGRFRIDALPKGGRIALKVAHPDFAQESLAEAPVNDAELKVVLQPGILVHGSVVSARDEKAVGGVKVTIRNAELPHDSVLAESDGDGLFMVRLCPGDYVYQAIGAEQRSVAWESLHVEGKDAVNLRVAVAGVCNVRGVLKDAVSSAAIPGARVLLENSGGVAASTRTDASGAFHFAAAAGQNVIRIDAVPGYAASENNAVKIMLAEGQDLDLPGFWLKPMPSYAVRILAEDGKTPVVGAAVTVLHPFQTGWRLSDANGLVTIQIAAMPQNGTITALAEDPSGHTGNLFHPGARGDAIENVALQRFCTVRGRLVGPDSKPVAGAPVCGMLPAKAKEGNMRPLWMTSTDANGAFRWDGVAGSEPEMCGLFSRNSESDFKSVAPNPGEAVDVGDITLSASETPKGVAYAGKGISWWENAQIAGPKMGKREALQKPTVLLYCGPEELPMLLDGVPVMRTLLPENLWNIVLVVNGSAHCEKASIPMYTGVAPGVFTTYLLDASGKVVSETIGMPPIYGARRLEVMK